MCLYALACGHSAGLEFGACAQRSPLLAAGCELYRNVFGGESPANCHPSVRRQSFRMESSYGVGVQNRFSLPDEDEDDIEDPQDILQTIEKKADPKKKEVVKKPAAKGPQAKGKPAEKNQNKTAAKPSPGMQCVVVVVFLSHVLCFCS